MTTTATVPRRASVRAAEAMPTQPIFICNICGMKAAQAVLCVRDDCMTPMLVHGLVSLRTQ